MKKFKPVFLFEGEGGQGSGVVTPASTPTPAVSNDGSHTNRTFTQDDLNKVAGMARGEGRQAALKDLLTKYGAADEAALEARLKELETLKAAQLSEQERLQKEASDAKAEADKVQKAAQSKLQKANDLLRKTALFAKAEKFNPDALDDLWTYIINSKDLYEKLVIADDDSVAGIEDVLKAVEEKKKHFLKPAATQQPAPRGTPQTRSFRQTAVPGAQERISRPAPSEF